MKNWELLFIWKGCPVMPEEELAGYEKLGVSLYLEGEPSNSTAIAKACQIADGGGYMRDYTEDEKGHIARVDFDFVIDEP